MQWLRAPFRNPLGQAVVALTDWAVKPVRRVVPGYKGVDGSTLVLAWVSRIRAGSARSRSSWTGRVRRRGRWRRSRFSRASSSSRRSIWLLIIVVIAQAILSWVAPDGPFAGVLNAMTFRFLAPIRRRVPPLGGTLDLSPLILIVALQLILHRFPSAGSRARCSCCSGEAHVHSPGRWRAAR